MTPNKRKLIGLTGNSGSGKTTVTGILKNAGAYIIDSDKIAHGIYNINSPCYLEVLDFFGEEILNSDKSIDRKKLGKIVFGDKEKLETLTKITHKYIYKIIYEKIEEVIYSPQYKAIVVDAPVLINTELEKAFDEIWVVYADRDTLIRRIIDRDNLNEKEAIKRLDNQPSFEEFLTHADVLINNNDRDFEELKRDVIANLK